MSISRKPRWDWAPHEPRMLELHRAGMSIPKIREDIISDNFRPCERSVYNWFQDRGLPTGHDRKWDHSQNGSTAKIGNPGSLARCKSPPAPPLDETAPPLPLPPLPSLNNVRNSSYEHNDCWPGISEALSEKLGDSSLLKRTVLEGGNTMNHDVAGLAADSRLPISLSQSPVPFETEESGTGRSKKHKKRSKLSPQEENDLTIEKLKEFGLLSNTQHVDGWTKPPHQIKKSTTSSSSHSKMVWDKLYQRSNKISNLQRTRASQSSPLPDNDSGYASGRGTPSTLPYRASLISEYELLSEFGGLHRVACYNRHELRHPYSYNGPISCNVCGYSAIHGLAWEAKHLEIAEFEQKLRTKDIYDVQALDAAGNSALHYAAISGAGYIHLKALIKAGAPLDVQNTAKQNFLHCLRPCHGAHDSGITDCFKFGLLALLERVESENVLGQQDNDGQTVLHTLASYIVEPELRDHTFKFFSKRGLPAGVINRFGKSAKDLRAPEYKFGQNMFAVDTISLINNLSRDNEIPKVSEWDRDQLRQMSDQNVIVHSHDNPRYMDTDTKDTVFHALSRVNAQPQSNIQCLRRFIAKGTNLNRHNCDGLHPLAAFVRNQRFRESAETGAVMSKYVDILLWKDKKRGLLNDINVDMMTSAGKTALYEAAEHAHTDTVRSLIEAGANVNVRLNNDPCGSSILNATCIARNNAVVADDAARVNIFKEVISHLELAGAVQDPTSFQARGRTK